MSTTSVQEPINDETHTEMQSAVHPVVQQHLGVDAFKLCSVMLFVGMQQEVE